MKIKITLIVSIGYIKTLNDLVNILRHFFEIYQHKESIQPITNSNDTGNNYSNDAADICGSVVFLILITSRI